MASMMTCIIEVDHLGQMATAINNVSLPYIIITENLDQCAISFHKIAEKMTSTFILSYMIISWCFWQKWSQTFTHSYILILSMQHNAMVAFRPMTFNCASKCFHRGWPRLVQGNIIPAFCAHNSYWKDTLFWCMFTARLSHHYKVLHMTWHHRCHVMCKILWWPLYSNLIESKTNLPWNLNFHLQYQ